MTETPTETTLSTFASERGLFAKAVAVYLAGFMEAEPSYDDLRTAECLMDTLERMMNYG